MARSASLWRDEARARARASDRLDGRPAAAAGVTLLAGQIGLLEVRHDRLGDALHRRDIVVDLARVDEDGPGIDELRGQRIRLERRIGLDRAARAQLVRGEGADEALAIGVLQHGAVDEAIL